MAGIPPVKGEAFTFYVTLTSQADTDTFQSNPTLAAGDVKVSIDGGTLNNLATLPDAEPDAGKQVRVQHSASEMDGDVIGVLFSDATGAEWQDLYIEILTDTQQIGDLAATGADGDTLETLSDQLDGVCTLGSGAIEWTYTLTNANSPFQAIADADVWMTTDEAGDNVIASGQTDASGEVTFYLDAGTVYVWRQKSGWNFTNPDTEEVTA
jgi:hypothetical protein